MTLSHPHPERPYELPGTMLGEHQLAAARALGAGRSARARRDRRGAGAVRRVRRATPPQELFSEVREVGVRDGADLVVEGYDFAPTFSIWTTIEECLNPPLIWERERGFYTTAALLRARGLHVPGGHRRGRVRQRRARGGRADPALGHVRAGDVQVRARPRSSSRCCARCTNLGWTRPSRCRVRGQQVAPRDVVAAALPDPATLGERMSGRTCAGTWVTGTGVDGAERSTYLYHVVDNETTMREYGSQAVVWQTAVNPVVALELLERGGLAGHGRARTRGVPAAAVPGAAGGAGLTALESWRSSWRGSERRGVAHDSLVPRRVLARRLPRSKQRAGGVPGRGFGFARRKTLGKTAARRA